ncbi:class I SAM-dependent methyltransferase [Desulfosporosinus sp. PR]|uniref:class I SAM-dependent methyltransferase n=1 Tax=Candidatus Desulfosporosinus nitrosoreducens TaxID=3401928 RepID=UPI0027E82EEF|nr:class I SAM-dependent methyltransferase [Desulfosporosinus sp. PR]MDQ7095643.1 class I SAM-dependent methyltransferase [Desulfosporosinus sp. PR]
MKRIDEYFNEEALIHDDDFIVKMGMTEFYDEIELQVNCCQENQDILVIGCGTGLEIERIKFVCNVTALDISPIMLEQLSKKQFYHGVNLHAICISVLDYDFGKNKYDIILTCYTLHHFNEEQKDKIYAKIYNSLKKNGVLINGDIVAQSVEEEKLRMQQAQEIYKQQNAQFAALHIDVPFTKEKEVSMLFTAGFRNVLIENNWSKTVLFKCIK